MAKPSKPNSPRARRASKPSPAILPSDPLAMLPGDPAPTGKNRSAYDPTDNCIQSEPDPADLDDLQLAVFALRSILTDKTANAAAKASAARTLAEMRGAIGRHAKPGEDDDRPLASMTRAELEAELKRA